MEKQVLFTETVKGEGRTYFFDMKEASNGKPYLCITEASKNKEGEFQRNRTFVFEEDFEKFASAVANTMKAYAGLEKAETA
ncbi:DUF3276 family protein [Phaeodactylibacter sp.]|jgi:hypothetical protein|uniref:DUF3276 family protein n=1 Tax=Phaeodactylibacter sp. TaxID=1940289 RepID=UPI0025F047C4|nr:DUF3276 family protein [Phaeodactylibacter sp.]MCI4648642.1 PUR family DNA/RNA-binding protein [Phaeodactylibacter sp.]MCI5091223.1 PUR family DNA/RNA-binding protein [Phaeodactylibacter sp.]